MAIKDTDRKARDNYKKKVSVVRVELYGTDESIKEHLDQIKASGASIQGYIKDLLRADMQRQEHSEKEDAQDEVYAIFTDSTDDACAMLGYCTSEADADKYCDDHQSEHWTELTWQTIKKL